MTQIRDVRTAVCAALALALGACGGENPLTAGPTFDMTGVYQANLDHYPMGQVSSIRFTGPGYCRQITGNPRGMTSYLDGRCELKDGGMEFNAGLPGAVRFYQIENGNLVINGVTLSKVQ